jgi:ABC-type transport system involved in multi-copper enzyme maturation permease subunit
MTAVAPTRTRGLPVLRLTFREVVSRKLVVWGIGLSGVFLALFGFGFWMLYRHATGGSEGVIDAIAATILTVLGLYVVSFLAAFLALLVSVGAVSGEIDSGTLQAVIARPLPRVSWLLQRWAALVLIVSAYVAVMTGALMLIARVIAHYSPTNPLLTVLLVMAQSAVILTLGMVASTRLSTLAAGVVGFSLFGLAWLAGIIEFIGGIVENPGMVHTGVAVSLLMPSDSLWRAASFFAQAPSAIREMAIGGGPPFVSSSPPTAASLWWALGWTVVVLLLGVRHFSRRDL